MKGIVFLVRPCTKLTRSLKKIDFEHLDHMGSLPSRSSTRLLASYSTPTPKELRDFIISEFAKKYERSGYLYFKGSEDNMKTTFLESCLKFRLPPKESFLEGYLYDCVARMPSMKLV